MKKPKWVIEKEQARRASASETVWLFGLHAVRDALENPMREKLRLVATQNALNRLEVEPGDVPLEMADARKFPVPLDPSSVHQGVALEVKPLNWGALKDVCKPITDRARVVVLDRVSDPHNVGAILRSAEVFGAQAVIAPTRHAAPETGALAKAASGALERQPYMRVGNLARALESLQEQGYTTIGLAGEAETQIDDVLASVSGPVAFVLGAEGPGLREKTREICDHLACIPAATNFGSLNVSNAAAVSLYAASRVAPKDIH